MLNIYNSNHQFNLWLVWHRFRFNKNFIRARTAVWKTHCTRSKEKPGTTPEALHHPSSYIEMLSNVQSFAAFLLTSLSAAFVERSNSSLTFVENRMRRSMWEDRLNALMLLYVRKDTELDIKEKINTFAKKHPRKMLFLNLLF